MSLKQFFSQVWFGGGSGVGVATLSASRTLTTSSAHVQTLTASGANRDVVLPATLGGARAAGQWYVIRNAGASNNLVVKDSAGTTIVTLAPGDWAWLMSGTVSGTTSWHVALSSTGLAGLTLTGALAAVAAAFTGRVTTTDGVASGTARVVGGLLSAVTATAPLTATASETVLASVSLPAGTIKAGTTIRYRAAVRVTGNVGSDTLTMRTRLGPTTLIGTAIVASAAVAMVADDVAIIEGVITGRAAPGGTASVASSATGIVKVGGTAASFGAAPVPSNFATNGVLLLEFTGQWSSNSGTNNASLYQFDVLAEG